MEENSEENIWNNQDFTEEIWYENKILSKQRKRDLKDVKKITEEIKQKEAYIIMVNFEKEVEKIKWKICWKSLDIRNHLMCTTWKEIWCEKWIESYVERNNKCINCKIETSTKDLVVNDSILDILRVSSEAKSITFIKSMPINHPLCNDHWREMLAFWEWWQIELWVDWILTKSHYGHIKVKLIDKISILNRQMNEKREQLKILHDSWNKNTSLLREVSNVTYNSLLKSWDELKKLWNNMMQILNSAQQTFDESNSLVNESICRLSTAREMLSIDLLKSCNNKISVNKISETIKDYDNSIKDIENWVINRLKWTMTKDYSILDFDSWFKFEIDTDLIKFKQEIKIRFTLNQNLNWVLRLIPESNSSSVYLFELYIDNIPNKKYLWTLTLEWSSNSMQFLSNSTNYTSVTSPITSFLTTQLQITHLPLSSPFLSINLLPWPSFAHIKQSLQSHFASILNMLP